MTQVSPITLCADDVWMEAALSILVLSETREGLMAIFSNPDAIAILEKWVFLLKIGWSVAFEARTIYC
jgi:hypothetical protein